MPDRAPPFQRNQFGASVGGPISEGQNIYFCELRGLAPVFESDVGDLRARPLIRAAALLCRSDPRVRGAEAACAAGCETITQLVACANGPELTLPTGASAASRQLLGSPLQTIREDFGTVRLDHVFSAKDTLSGIYTIDDSADVTATPLDPFSTDIASLREQVLSLEETHVFSPTL